MHDDTYFVLRLPFTIGVVTTLLLFSGWLRTERGTVIRAGNFPCRVNEKKNNPVMGHPEHLTSIINKELRVEKQTEKKSHGSPASEFKTIK